MDIIRLTKKSEFCSLYKKQDRILNSGFIVLYELVDAGIEPVFKMGCVTSKKVGNAVIRNRCRRRIKALFKDLLYNKELKLDFSINILVIARNAMPRISYRELYKDIKKCLKKIAMVK